MSIRESYDTIDGVIEEGLERVRAGWQNHGYLKVQVTDEGLMKRSLDAARDARAKETPKELERRVDLFQRSTTADAVYLRLIIHCNEHMGQLVAYARMTGVTPPWSKD